MGNSISLNITGGQDGESHVVVNSRRRGGRGLPSPATSDSSGREYLSAHSNSSSSCSHASDTQECEAVSSPKQRQCWICYGEEDVRTTAAFEAQWVAPCACRGTTKWVHQACLLDWIDSQLSNGTAVSAPVANTPPTTHAEHGDSNASPRPPPEPRFAAGGPLVLQGARLACPQCHAPYRIAEEYALPRVLLRLVDHLAQFKERSLIWATLGLVSGSIYTIGFTYGVWSGWIAGRDDFLGFLRDAYGANSTLLSRLQASVAIPMLPLFALSSSFSVFSWIYPLVPLLLYDGRHPILPFRPRGILLALPLLWTTHELVCHSLLPLLARRILDRDRTGVASSRPAPPITVSAAHPEADDSSAAPVPANGSPSADSLSISSSDSLSSTTSTVRISILTTTASLLFPTAAAVTGWLLSLVLPRSLAQSLGQTPFYRALLGAGVLVTIKDLSRLLYWYQTVRLRRFRRVLNRIES